MELTSKIVVFGHNGMVGSSILRYLKSKGYRKLITMDRKQLDLTNQQQVINFFESIKPEYVFLAAAKVGGIYANNTYKADFIYNNIMIESNVIHNSYKYGAKKLLFLASSCIYPRNCPQPMKEEYLLTGELEPTNDAYAVAKIAGIKMCQSYHSQYGCNFISVMPTNLMGPNDNYDLNDSHVLPALMRKVHEAKMSKSKSVTVWGTGTPLREFLHVDDVASACLFLMNNYNSADIINIGSGKEITISNLTKLLSEIIKFDGEVVYDSSKPDGTPRKLLDISKITSLGWKPKIPLYDGIQATYEDFKKIYRG